MVEKGWAQFLPRRVKELENATDTLEQHRSILARLNPEYHERYVLPAQRHADSLHKRAAQLALLFNATREVSEFPLRAAKIYQTIIDALDAAEQAAKRASLAADLAHKEVSSDGQRHHDTEHCFRLSPRLRTHSLTKPARLSRGAKNFWSKPGNSATKMFQVLPTYSTRDLQICFIL
ncbi:LAMA2 [Cordylochernes scorpioides]|uniref:LAMA2 n=1 Tax=Cordylochernes scorpioides TaxID=51811 RepID=A0ABY6L9C7_9ARAC|nr:LAMA2 [Cordylochernes scorpioides]